MRTGFLIVALLVSTSSYGQSGYFTGSIEMGVGPSMVFDNQDYNSGVAFGFLTGISVARNINQTTAIETGFYYSLYQLGYTFRLSDHYWDNGNRIDWAMRQRRVIGLHFLEIPFFACIRSHPDQAGLLFGYSNGLLYRQEHSTDYYGGREIRYKFYQPILYMGCDVPIRWKRQGEISARVLLSFTPFDLLEPESKTIIDQEVSDPWFGSVQRLIRLILSVRYTFV